MSKLLSVVKYEYLQTVKRPSFWITTLFLPIFFIIIFAIQIYSTSQTEELFNKLSADIKEIRVIDETGIIQSNFYTGPVVANNNLAESLDKLKKYEIDAVIYYPKSVVEDGKYQVYAKDKGLLGGTSFTSLGDSMLNQSVISRVDNVELQKLLTKKISGDSTFYDKDGKEVKIEVSDFILPILSLVIFFMSVTMSSQYLLQSVSEEKENRMIETMLSMISSRTLIVGKIIGLSGVVLTQVTIWMLSAAGLLTVGANLMKTALPINFSDISFAPLPLNLFFTLTGFLLFAAIMVGVGSIGTSYRDSQSLSGIFIMLSVMPFYFITILIADPNGPLAVFTSYFPLTAPMILLIRNSLQALSPVESIIGIIVMIAYVVIAFWAATKMFDLGSLMYNRRPTFKEVWNVLRK